MDQLMSTLTLIAAAAAIIAGCAAAYAYIRAGGYSKPVVEALTARVTAAEHAAEGNAAKAAAAMEVATGRAAVDQLIGKVEALTSSVQTLVAETVESNGETLKAIQQHENRAQRHDQLVVANLSAIAGRLERKPNHRAEGAPPKTDP